VFSGWANAGVGCLIFLMLFPNTTASTASAQENTPQCWTRFEIKSEPVGAHIYYDATGEELSFSESEKTSSLLTSCSKTVYQPSGGCSYSFTAKKSGFKEAHHTIRNTFCNPNPASRFAYRFTMVLDAL